MPGTRDGSRRAREAGGADLHLYSPEGTVAGDGGSAAAAAPRPLIRNWFTVIHHGHVIQFIGERWWTCDAANLPYPCKVDPRRPEESIAARLIDLVTGEVLSPASDSEIEAALGRAQGEARAFPQ